jgi:hypothetical protein
MTAVVLQELFKMNMHIYNHLASQIGTNCAAQLDG